MARIDFCKASNPCPVCSSYTKGCNHPEWGDGYHLCRGTPSSSDWVCVDPETANGEHKGYRRKDDLRRKRRDKGGPREDWSLLDRPSPRRETDAERFRAIAFIEQGNDTADELTAIPAGMDWAKLAASAAKNCTTRRREELAAILHLPVSALLGVPGLGYVQEAKLIDGCPTEVGYWTFPERDAVGNIIGILRRWRKGHGPKDIGDKMRMFGCHGGLTLPPNWDILPSPAVNVEGPTDCAAMFEAGFACTGRPGAGSGADLLIELFANEDPDCEILIVGDNDLKPDGSTPGKTGAISNASKVSDALKRIVKWAVPPEGFKDVREYLTAAFWGDTPYLERGEKLRAHFEATAVVADPSEPIGYDNVSEAEARELMKPDVQPVAPTPERPPGETDAIFEVLAGSCAITAADEVRESLIPTCICKHPRPLIGKRVSTGRRGSVPFGCHKYACPTCGNYKKALVFESSEPYMQRAVTEGLPATHEDGDKKGECTGEIIPMILYQAIVPKGRNASIKRAMQRRHDASFMTIDTTDREAAIDLIAEGMVKVSHLRHAQEQPTCPKSDIGQYTLWTTLISAKLKPPAGFTQMTLGGAYYAIGNAFQTMPSPSENVKRFKPVRQSKSWGDEIEKKPGDFIPEGTTRFTQAQIRQFAEALKVKTEFWFAGPRVQGSPVGWEACPATSLCFSLMLRGIDEVRPHHIDELVSLGRDWLKAIACNVGDGWHVEQVLKKYLWVGPPWDGLDEELLAADAKDQAHAALNTELHSLRNGLRDTYRGRLHEASELVQMLLA